MSKESCRSLELKNQSERSGEDLKKPKDRHGKGNDWPVEHGSENKSLRVQSAAGDIKHAEPRHEEANQPKVISGLWCEGFYPQQRNCKMRREQYDGSFEENQPTENLHGLG